MKGKALLICGFLMSGIWMAGAQGSGRIISAPDFIDASQRLLFSQNDYIYGTSRSAAMGGAFTSLGADLSSMNINPAGLGMYQSSDWGITQSLSINSMKTTADMMPAGTLSSGGNRTSYGLNNIAVAWNLFNRSERLTSLTFGFGYNRMANFNSRSFVGTTGESVSIANMFYHQLNAMKNAGIGADQLSTSSRPFDNTDIYLREWGAVLGFQTGLISGNSAGYDEPSRSATTDSFMESTTKGGIYEYAFSLGANIDNVLYLGTTMGFTQISYSEDLTYEETYRNNARVNAMWFDQSMRMNGSGFTMKLGAVARPIPDLRIGVAFHLPTFYVIEKSYNGAMGALDRRNTGTLILEEQKFNSAPRILAGVSYVIADRAIVAVDYECAWYNRIRLRNTDSRSIEESKNESLDTFNPANTVRAGLEILASDIVSVRVGGAYSMDFMSKDDWVANNPAPKSSYSITGGLGFNVGNNTYIDLSYIYNRADYTNYDFFFYDDRTNWAGQYNVVNGSEVERTYSPRKNLHMITLTLGSRF